MNWISDYGVIISFTFITANVMSIVWLLIFYFIKKYCSPSFLYNSLKVIIVSHLIPWYLIISWVYGMLNSGLTLEEAGADFRYGRQVDFFAYLGCVFLLGTIVFFLLQVKRSVAFVKIRRNAMRVPVKMEQVLQDVKEELNIKKTIKLRRGYEIMVPFVTGIVHPVVYVPVDEYSDECLEVILKHELYHLKNMDGVWKTLFYLACWIYWFNPLTWILYRFMINWCEINCDYQCCKNKSDQLQYFEVISKLCEGMIYEFTDIVPAWIEGKVRIEWRRKMLNISGGRTMKKRYSIAIAMVALCVSCVSVVAAEKEYTKEYVRAWEKNRESIDETQNIEEVFEYQGTIEDFDDTTVIYDEDNGIALATTGNVSWSVGNNVTRVTNGFYVASGSNINIAGVIDPAGKMVQIGIIQPDTSIRYVMLSSSVGYTFSINQSGTYKIFVKNTCGTTVQVSFYYVY